LEGRGQAALNNEEWVPLRRKALKQAKQQAAKEAAAAKAAAANAANKAFKAAPSKPKGKEVSRRILLSGL
jgi:hypothetical protein